MEHAVLGSSDSIKLAETLRNAMTWISLELTSKEAILVSSLAAVPMKKSIENVKKESVVLPLFLGSFAVDWRSDDVVANNFL